MPSAAKLSPDTRFFGLFIGETGSGKTPAACSFPGPVYDFDFDGKIRSLLNCPWIDRNKVEYDYYPPLDLYNKEPKNLITRINEKLELFNTLYRMGPAAASMGQLPKTIVIDSTTAACQGFLTTATSWTHGKNAEGKDKGKKLGVVNMWGPEDYGLESKALIDLVATMKSLPIENVIFTAHVVPTYGKSDPNDSYSASVITGEKLALRDKISATLPSHFNHIFRFYRYESAGRMVYTFKAWSDIAMTAFPGLPMGEIDITNKSFYDVLMSYVKKGDSNVITLAK